MPICITGMHRSGTSMVAHLLQTCGVDLGPAEGLIPANQWNPDGYFENRRFVLLADDLLEALDGGWDAPPARSATEVVESGARRAEALAADLGLAEPWGWKDPRAALLMPVWLEAFPDLRVVVCVRNPIEVILSLRRRGATSPLRALQLWTRHYEDILAGVPAERRVVTSYNAYFADAQGELERVLAALGLAPEQEAVTAALALVNAGFRRAGADEELRVQLPPAVATLYGRLLAEAGAAPPAAQPADAARPDGRAPLGGAIDAALDRARRQHALAQQSRRAAAMRPARFPRLARARAALSARRRRST